MKTFFLFFSLLLAIATSIAGWLFFREKFPLKAGLPSPQEVKKSYQEDVIETQRKIQQDNQYYNQAINVRSSEFCNKIEDTKKKQTCIDMVTATLAYS